ncbi:hypothetical protein ACFW6V_16370 [Streptomyces sp. NPDC058734]|uniref:hypothetical protein n=1 Tax=Streptomyces sp. NPDC058734 TaxID=3346615 RepID=UPI0036AA98B2
MDLEQLRAPCGARIEALRLPHRSGTRGPHDAVAEPRGRPAVRRRMSTPGAVGAPCGLRLETPDAHLPAPPADGTRSRKGGLPAENARLPLVAAAHAPRPAARQAGPAS